LSLIEAYPFNNKTELVKFLSLLKNECETRNIDWINSFTVDYDWDNYPGRWEELLTIHGCANRLGLDFGLIYWPAPHTDSTDTDLDFLQDILYEGACYQSVGGSPEIFAVQSWVYIPYEIVPEQPDNFDQYPFCYAFLCFYDQFIGD